MKYLWLVHFYLLSNVADQALGCPVLLSLYIVWAGDRVRLAVSSHPLVESW